MISDLPPSLARRFVGKCAVPKSTLLNIIAQEKLTNINLRLSLVDHSLLNSFSKSICQSCFKEKSANHNYKFEKCIDSRYVHSCCGKKSRSLKECDPSLKYIPVCCPCMKQDRFSYPTKINKNQSKLINNNKHNYRCGCNNININKKIGKHNEDHEIYFPVGSELQEKHFVCKCKLSKHGILRCNQMMYNDIYTPQNICSTTNDLDLSKGYHYEELKAVASDKSLRSCCCLAGEETQSSSKNKKGKLYGSPCHKENIKFITTDNKDLSRNNKSRPRCILIDKKFDQCLSQIEKWSECCNNSLNEVRGLLLYFKEQSLKKYKEK